MPRIRTIKPDFWDSADTASADLRTRLLYIAMWNWADDYGIGDGHPGRIITFAFPNDDIPAADYPRILADVSSAFGAVFFEHAGRPYFVIPAWDTHQRTEKKAKPKEGLLEAAQAAIQSASLAGQPDDAESPTLSADNPPPSGESSDAGSRKGKLEREREISVETSQVCHQSADTVAPAQKCFRHLNDPNPPDCGGCASAAREYRAWNQKQQKVELELQSAIEEARAARKNCHDCDDYGRLDDLSPCPKHPSLKEIA